MLQNVFCLWHETLFFFKTACRDAYRLPVGAYGCAHFCGKRRGKRGIAAKYNGRASARGMPKLLLFCVPIPVRKRIRVGVGAIGWVHAALKGEPEASENAEPAHLVLGQRLWAKTPHRIEA